jgi:secreted trypsin-like serine protease
LFIAKFENTIYLSLTEPCNCGVILSHSSSNEEQQQVVTNQKFVVDDIKNQIFGGAEVAINAIPWQVGIEINGIFPYCGGTIIGPTTVLTAAHCVSEADLAAEHIKIIVAEHDLKYWGESETK